MIEEYENQSFWHMFIKYEESILFALNTLELSLEELGEIDSDVMKEVEKIIQKFGHAMYIKVEEIAELEKLQLEAVKNGLINNVRQELDFIEEYIE